VPSPGDAIDAIDVVVAWVDGADPRHRAKRNRYLAGLGRDAKPDQAANKDRRFSDNDEIRFCLRSIRNYAPWARTIWLVTDDQVPAAIDRRRAESENINIVDHREIFRGYERLLPTFNSMTIEGMLWRIEGLADRFLYFNDDMMFVGSVEPTDFFSNDGKVNLRGRWTSLQEQLRKGSTFHAGNKLHGAEMLGYTSEHFFSSAHMIYPLLRPAMEELFEEFKPAFLTNAEHRFRDRNQFWPISAHDHLLLKSNRAKVVKIHRSAHFSVRYCLAASPEDLEARLKQLADGTMRLPASTISRRSPTKCPTRWTICRRRPGRRRRSKTRLSKSCVVRRTLHAISRAKYPDDWESDGPVNRVLLAAAPPCQHAAS
jgi:hypothetical protein